MMSQVDQVETHVKYEALKNTVNILLTPSTSWMGWKHILTNYFILLVKIIPHLMLVFKH